MHKARWTRIILPRARYLYRIAGSRYKNHRKIPASGSILVMAFTVAMPIAMSVAVAMPIAVVAVSILPVVALIRIAVMTVAMLFAVARCVFIGVPAILNKIHLLAAGVIGTTVLRPVFCVAGRNTQIDRLPFNVAGRALYHYRLRINDAWLREVTDIDAAVKPRLTDIDGYADVCCHRR